MMKNSLHTKYRPETLADVIGQDHVVKSLETLIENKQLPQAVLLTGPSGCGKTTIARIIAKEAGCDPINFIEIDAATHTGIDAMRDLQTQIMYKGFGENNIKVVILDEVHQLSKSAFNSLLKVIEEPKDHVYWMLCTTEASKIPKTIKTRCHSYDLKPVRTDDILELLDYVCEKEEIELDNKSLSLIARESEGSPRQALVFLSMSVGCENRDEVADVIESCADNHHIIDLCKMMVGKSAPSWKKVQAILKDVKDENPESIRIMITNYFSSCVLNTSSLDDAERFVDILDAFSTPCNSNDKMAPIILSLFSVLFD